MHSARYRTIFDGITKPSIHSLQLGHSHQDSLNNGPTSRRTCSNSNNCTYGETGVRAVLVGSVPVIFWSVSLCMNSCPSESTCSPTP